MALPPAQTEAEAPLPPEQHPGGLGSLSDDELKQQYAKAQNPLAGMSDEELTRAYHQSNPTGSQGIPLTGYLSQPAQPIGSEYDPYIKQSSMGRILNAFGQGAAQGWGAGDVASDDVSDVMRKAGIFNDVQEGHNTIARSFNEAFLRPPIAILSHMYGGIAAGIEGSIEAAQAASQELPNVSPVTGEGYLRESLASLLNPRQAGEFASQQLEQRLTTGVSNEFGLPALPNLTVAQAMKVIPGGDNEYFGLTNASNSPIDGAAATIKAARDAAKEQTGTPYQYEPGALGAQPTEGGIGAYTPQSIDVYAHQHPEDIHAAARNVDPQTFQKYDALNIQAEDLRDRISQASEENRTAAAAQAPHAAEIEDLNNKLASEPTPRLAKKYTARIAELQPEHDAFLESDQHAMLTRDTDQVSDMRQELQKLDYQMRDLAPQVTAAYREAGRQFPELITEPEQARTERQPAPETSEPKVLGLETEPPTSAVAAQPENALASLKAAPPAGPIAPLRPPPPPTIAKKEGVAEPAVQEQLPEIPDWQKQNNASAVDFANRLGLTEHIGQLAKEGRTAKQISEAIGGKLDAGEVRAVRDSLGIQASGPVGMMFGPNIPQEPGRPGAIEAARTAEEPRIIPANAIMQDVSSKLQAAGRPAEEADAAAAVVQARYEARAQAFGGAKGNAHELYEREGPVIQGAEKGRMGVNGQTSIKDGQTIVTLFKRADASTFLHEMGHHWLEEISGDAKDDAATPQMKSDWDAVRNYLKQPDDGIITRRAHEKFARGFERYMMEGVAPTRALDGVFAKFKDWLTTIYQSVNKLRSPITADIRDVFDRMLGKGTEPATITPEAPHIPEAYEPSKPTPAAGLTRDLASLHETDAETTPPQFADQVADQIRDEREETIAKQVPDVRPTDESTAGAGAEAGGGEQRSGEAGQAEPAAGSGRGNAAEPEAERHGGSQVTDKGVSAYESAEPSDNPTYAAQRYAGPDSRPVDYGNLFRRMTEPQDVLRTIRQIAADNGGFQAARRGVMSDQELLDLSSALGMDAYKLNERKLGKAFNAEETKAAYDLLINHSNEIRALKEKYYETHSDEDAIAYGEAEELHKMIQSQVSGLTAETGRALRAIRLAREGLTNQGLADIANLTGAAGPETLYQLRARLDASRGLNTPMEISKFINDGAYKPNFQDMLLEYFVNSLISGPATHTTYMVGNAMLAMWRAVPETAIQAAISSIRQAPAGERVYWGEIGAQLHGMMYGSRNGVVAGWAALKSGQTEPLPHEEFDAMSPKQVTKYDAARAQGMTHDEAIKSTLGINYHVPVQFVLGGKGAAIPDFNVAGVPLPLGSVIRAPSRVVGGIHSFFRAMGYSQEVSRLSYRMAADEGLVGDAFARRVAELTTSPPEDMMAAARAVATEQTLMGRGGPLTQAIAHLTDVVPPLKFVMPFVKIGSNIMSQGFIERTPIGALYPEIRANLMGRNGAMVRDEQISRMIAGVGVASAFTGLATEGMATGAAPDDPKEAAVWRAAGNQEYSARIGDTWYGLHRFGPIGLLSGFGADLYQYGHELSVSDADKVGMTIVGGFARGILDETWLRGPSELIQAMTNPTEYGQKFIDDEVTSFMPFSVGMAQMARAADPYQHQARGILQTAQNKTPFWSRGLLPEYDIFGQPMRSRAVFGMAGLSAVYETQLNNDPVPKAMLRLGVFPGPVKRSIDGIQLTDQQYAEYAQQAGTRAKMILDMKLGTPGYTDLPEGIQAKDIRDTFTKSRLWAESLVKAQNPDIMIKAMQQKHEIAVNGSGKGEK